MADSPSLDGVSSSLKLEFKKPISQPIADILVVNALGLAKLDAAVVSSKEFVTNPSGIVGLILGFQIETSRLSVHLRDLFYFFFDSFYVLQT